MLNRVILIGRLTKDIEIKKTNSGLSVTSFTVAVNRRTSNGNEADFINCTAWRNTADFLGKYASKGNLVSVEGRIQTRNYQNNEGRTVYVTEVVCDSAQLLESRAQRDGSSSYDSNSYSDNSGNNQYSNNNSSSNNSYQGKSSYQNNDSYQNDSNSYQDSYSNNSQGNNYNKGSYQTSKTYSQNENGSTNDDVPALDITSDDLPF